MSNPGSPTLNRVGSASVCIPNRHVISKHNHVYTEYSLPCIMIDSETAPFRLDVMQVYSPRMPGGPKSTSSKFE